MQEKDRRLDLRYHLRGEVDALHEEQVSFERGSKGRIGRNERGRACDRDRRTVEHAEGCVAEKAQRFS